MVGSASTNVTRPFLVKGSSSLLAVPRVSDVTICTSTTLDNLLLHSFKQLSFTGKRPRVVAADYVDLEVSEAGDLDPNAALISLRRHQQRLLPVILR